MGRLIDEDEFYKGVIEGKKFVWQMHDLLRNEIVVQTAYEDLVDFVRTIPTAYDVEAVVRELEEEWNKAKDMYSKHRTTALLFKANAFRDAIEIVKRGGRNERTD